MRALPGEPFSIEHFEAWSAQLTLDTGGRWKLEPFQHAFVADVFRGFPECWLIVPEGNGKTTLLSGLALYHLKFTQDAAIAVAASSKDQARWMYRQARGFVKRGGAWGLRAFDGYRKITHDEGNGELEIFAADDRTGDGIIPTLCVLDELHRHKTLDLYETWRGKLDKRGAQLIAISTAGEPGSEFEETRERIRQMGKTRRDGAFVRVEHPQLVLHEWAVPENGDIRDFGLVASANPFSLITAGVLEAKFATPSMTIQHWRRFTCNLPTRSEYAAIQEQEWFAAAVDEEIPDGEPIYVGVDIGWKHDTTAIVPLWWRDDEFRLLGKPAVLVPPRDGSSLDPDEVKRAFLEMHARNPIHTAVMDLSQAGTELADWVQKELGAQPIEWGQSNSYAAASYEKFMEALREGWLRHVGDETLTRHVLNAIAKMLPYGDEKFERPSQSRSASFQDRRVIDALVAAASVHAFVADNPASKYATEPLVVV